MKHHVMAGCLAILLCAGCSKAPLISADAKPANGNSFVLFQIRKGKHYADHNNYSPVKTDQLHFKVIFDSTAVYTTRLADNQSDINKLYGFSDNNMLHQKYSARFGWRWSGDALRLFAYVYNDGVRSFRELGPVAIGGEQDCKITIAGDQYIFSLNGRETSMPRTAVTARAEGYRLYPYFGGDETAPHDVRILLREIQISE